MPVCSPISTCRQNVVRWLSVFGFVSMSVLLGCAEKVEIRQYTVPKPKAVVAKNKSPAGPAIPTRTLAAIVPGGEQAWFFKLTGADAAVATHEEKFIEFLKSLKFTEGKRPEPKWMLPEGWMQKAGNELRFATIEIPSTGKPLELTVIPLSMSDGLTDEYSLSNVNRWRGQLQLGPITKEQLGDETTKLELPDGVSAVYVNMVGMSQGNDMGRPPFASGAGPFSGNAAPDTTPKPVRETPKEKGGESDLRYEVPEGWQKSAGNSLSALAFEVKNGKETAEVTLTALAAAAGDLLPNVDRWRRQIKLGPTTAEQLKSESRKVPVGDIEGTLVELVGPEDANPREAILGVVAIEENTAWFIKLKGPASVVEKEKKNFESFVRSLYFHK